MGKFNHASLSEKDQAFFLGAMFEAVAKLKNKKEVDNFFCDFLSSDEIVTIARRVMIAKLLLEGYTRNEIVTELKTGAATVNKVDKWLTKGFGNYRNKVRKIRNEKGFVDYNDCPLSFAGLANKYPAHFWLLKWLVDLSKK